MVDARDPWWIIGSAAVVLHGVGGIQVADVDVLLGRADARRLLSALDIVAQPGPDHPAFRSGMFATWRAHPVPIEFMAGFHHREGGEWLPVVPCTRESVAFAGHMLFVPAREELRALLDRFARPKDLERARLL